MQTQQYEGYVITDELRIGSVRYAIAEKCDVSKSYVTLEQRQDTDDPQPHYLRSRIAAEVDLIKRAVMQMRYELRGFTTDMQATLKREADLLEI